MLFRSVLTPPRSSLLRLNSRPLPLLPLPLRRPPPPLERQHHRHVLRVHERRVQADRGEVAVELVGQVQAGTWSSLVIGVQPAAAVAVNNTCGATQAPTAAAPRDAMTELHAQEWLNTDQPLTLESFRGKVLAVEVFQMLCPGCVSHGLPQAERLTQVFAGRELAVLGLHTVFEHHAVMTVEALRAFIHEYRWSFPIGVDQPDGRGGPSRSMARYGLRGTPSHLVLDRDGRVRLQHFGRIDDLVLGAILGGLVQGGRRDSGHGEGNSVVAEGGPGCTSSACSID